jgi:integral membrane protein (TIGR01906 family)
MTAATAAVLLGASVAPFLTPPVVHLEQSRTAVYSTYGDTWAEIDRVTLSLLGDLVFWTGDFGVQAGPARCCPEPVLNDAERAHMRDVRTVFTGFWLLVLAGVATLAVGFRRARASTEARVAAWRAVAGGARALAVVIAVAGVFALVAFDMAFEMFHRLFFSAGSYTFDPARDRLVQLFPERFWSEISIAVGAVALTLALVTAWAAGRRARSNDARRALSGWERA